MSAERDRDGLNAARGMVVGIMICLVFWGIVAALWIARDKGWPL